MAPQDASDCLPTAFAKRLSDGAATSRPAVGRKNGHTERDEQRGQ